MNAENVAVNGGGALGLIFFLFIALIVLVTVGLWIWSLIHCIKNKDLNDTNRIIGVVLIVVLGLIGSFVYLFLPREKTIPIDKSESLEA